MDPLSVSLGIAGIVPLIAKVISSTQKYLNSVTGAKKMIQALMAELEALKSNVVNLRDLLDSESMKNAGITFGETSVLVTCSTACEANLRELSQKLRDQSVGRMARYLWPFSEKEHQKVIGELRNYTSWIQFALSVNGCRLLSRTSENVVAVLGQQLEQFKAIKLVEEKTAELHNAVQKQSKLLQDEAHIEARRKILDWLSVAKPATRHLILRRSRAKNTGSWLLHSQEYMAWRDGYAPSRVLWCKGVQGSGKTILATTVIDDLLDNCTGPRAPIGFFYFDHQDQESQTPLTLACSILRQLLEHLPHLTKSASALYLAHNKDGHPSIYDCERIIREISQISEAVYIVIDALDECDNARHLKPVLQLIDRLSQISNCRLLVTSRPYVNGLGLSFGRSSYIKIEAHIEDIRHYVVEECNAGNLFDIADQPFVDRLVENLAQRARGLFLLPVLQLRAVLNEPTVGEMEDKLVDLSHNLSDAFEDTLSRIRRLPPSRSHLATSALMHLTQAKRRLRVSELSDILALKPNKSSVNTKYRPTAKMILECCQGLITLDQETGHIHLAHYAIYEYLVANADAIFPGIEVKLAHDCLRYLLLDDFKAGPLETEADIQSRLEAYPFFAYASKYCGKYARNVENNPIIWNALLDFYGSSAATAAADQARRFAAGYHEGYYTANECLSSTPLHNAARHGLQRSVKAMLDRGFFRVNERSKMGTTPIIHAACNGHVAIVQLLLKHGADPRLSNWYGNALQCAAESGQCETIRELVTWGMDPNAKDNGRIALSCALDRDSAQTFELLVDLGADINMPQESDGSNIFSLACSWNCGKTVDLMLRRGWIDITSDTVRSALHNAAFPVFQMLIDAGADVAAVHDDKVTRR